MMANEAMEPTTARADRMAAKGAQAHEVDVRMFGQETG